jgi:hypothetical protein
MSLKRLAALALHHQLALRRYVPLKRQIERSEVRDAIADGQRRRDPDIWALRRGGPGGDALDETASIRPIEESRRVGRRSRRRRYGRWRWLRGASRDRDRDE